MPQWHQVRAARRIDRQRRPAAREVQAIETLVHVEPVRDRSQLHQRDRCDVAHIRLNDKRAVVADRVRRGADHRTGAFEQVGRGINLRVLVIQIAVGDIRRCAAAHRQDATIGQEQHGVMVDAPHGHRRQRRPLLGIRIPDLRCEHGPRGIVVTGGAGSTQRQHRAIGEQRSRELSPAEVHRGCIAPCGSRRIQVDDFRAVGRQILVPGIFAPTDDHHLPRPIHHRRSVIAKPVSARRHLSPLPCAGGVQVIGSPPGPGVEDFSIGRSERVRINRQDDLSRREVARRAASAH